MKVKQLIAALEAHDPDAEVGMDFGDGDAVPANQVTADGYDVVIQS